MLNTSKSYCAIKSVDSNRTSQDWKAKRVPRENLKVRDSVDDAASSEGTSESFEEGAMVSQTLEQVRRTLRRLQERQLWEADGVQCGLDTCTPEVAPFQAILPRGSGETGPPAAFLNRGPEERPDPAVIAMASAPQNVTRIAPTARPAPPTRAANPPKSARKNSEVPATKIDQASLRNDGRDDQRHGCSDSEAAGRRERSLDRTGAECLRYAAFIAGMRA